MIDTDVLILGAGTAGLNARRAAERAGARALVLDPGPLGTTCARVGCMPSKLLIAAAEANWHMSQAGKFGVYAEWIYVRGGEVMERVQRERDRFVGFVLEDSAELESRGLLLRQAGRFTGPNTVQAGEREIRFRTAVIATGSKPRIPEEYQPFSDILLTNETLFELPKLPASALVVGTGVVGLELGQAMSRLGVRVSILGRRDVCGPLTDPLIRAVARNELQAELHVYFNHKLESLTRVPEGVEARWDGLTERFERILIATGRRPNLSGLNLQATGILDENGVLPKADPHTGQLRTSHLFAAGDVTGYRPLLHEASDEGNIAGENAARWPEPTPRPRRVPLEVVFCDPQIALVGMRFVELDRALHAIGEVNYINQGRARVMAQNRGRVRIYGERATGRLLGAEMFGPRVEHTAHLLAWAVQAGLTVDQALEMPFYHPVIEEGIRTALRDLAADIRKGSSP